jgi:hypothetical protein
VQIANLIVRGAVWCAIILAVTSTASADISRPLPDQGPTKVEVKVSIFDVDDVDGANQNFEANLFYQVSWHDPRLAHEDADGISRPLTEIWNPRIQLLNKQRIWKSFPDTAGISPNGDVVYRQRVWGSFSQPLELRDFPFDQQVFEVILVAVGHSTEQVELVVDPSSQIAERFSLPDWSIDAWKVESKPLQIVPGEQMTTAVVFSLEATRRVGYFIGKVIVPLVLIVAMSWVVFWIDPKESGSQIGVAITAMLTLIAYRFAAGANLPKVEYMTRLDLFILGASVMVFASLVQVVATSYFAKTERLATARQIDIWCRWLFPTIFVLVGLETLILRLLA